MRSTAAGPLGAVGSRGAAGQAQCGLGGKLAGDSGGSRYISVQQENPAPAPAFIDTGAALSLVKAAPQAGEKVKQVPLKPFQGKPRRGWEWAQVPFSTQGFETKGK